MVMTPSRLRKKPRQPARLSFSFQAIRRSTSARSQPVMRSFGSHSASQASSSLSTEYLSEPAWIASGLRQRLLSERHATQPLRDERLVAAAEWLAVLEIGHAIDVAGDHNP